MADHYATLGVPRSASQDEIQRAYRALARRHHPDLDPEPGADERFRAISEAYRVLSDPERRRRGLHDRIGDAIVVDVRPMAPEEAIASAAISTSASGITTAWFFAPPSACTRLPCDVAVS